jgi:hypothetical protein
MGVPSSKVKKSKDSVEDGARWVIPNVDKSPRDTTEERSSHLRGGGSLKSRFVEIVEKLKWVSPKLSLEGSYHNRCTRGC